MSSAATRVVEAPPVAVPALPIVPILVETSSFATSPYVVYECVPRVVSTAVEACVTETVTVPVPAVPSVPT